MNRSTPHNVSRTTFLAVTLCGALFSCASRAELNLSITPSESQQSQDSSGADRFDVNFQKRAAGIDKYKMSKGLKVTGWQFRDGVYFGQAKVGKKWGVGVIVDRGRYVYGINNRGIQLLRRL